MTASYRHATARAIAVQGVEVAAAAGWRAQPLTAVATPGKGVAHAVLEAADRHGASVIVVGRRGRSGIARAILGGVSDGVLRRATRPVLVVPNPRW